MTPQDLNPIIGDSTAITMGSVQMALSFIRRTHEEAAGAWHRSRFLNLEPADAMSGDEHNGLAYLISCLEAALRYEYEVRSALPASETAVPHASGVHDGENDHGA